MWRRALLLAIALTAPARAEDLKIATWNLNWLTLRPAGAPGLPPDVEPRQPDDFDRLAAYARNLNADVVALQEVDGYQPASRLFPRETYSLHFSHDHVVQRVAIAVRRELHYEVNPDLTALAERHLRSGVDITLALPSGALRILAVHLKKGCRDAPLQHARGEACETFRQQVPVLAAWIADRQQEGIPFLVLGDFNRSMDKKELPLSEAKPLVRATEGRSSPCWGNESFIDHIFAGGAAAQWLDPASLRVLVYQETNRSWQDRLSDHCPVSVRLHVPG